MMYINNQSGWEGEQLVIWDWLGTLDKKCVDPRNSAVFYLRILGLFPFLSNKTLGFHIHSGYWFLKMIPTYDGEEAYLMTDQHLFLNASG
jgi:hypothetical protein